MFDIKKTMHNGDRYVMTLGSPMYMLGAFAVLSHTIPKESHDAYAHLLTVPVTDEEWYDEEFWTSAGEEAERVLAEYGEELQKRDDWDLIKPFLDRLIVFGKVGKPEGKDIDLDEYAIITGEEYDELLAEFEDEEEEEKESKSHAAPKSPSKPSKSRRRQSNRPRTGRRHQRKRRG